MQPGEAWGFFMAKQSKVLTSIMQLSKCFTVKSHWNRQEVEQIWKSNTAWIVAYKIFFFLQSLLT